MLAEECKHGYKMPRDTEFSLEAIVKVFEPLGHYLMIFYFSSENPKFGVRAGGLLPMFISSSNAPIANYSHSK